MASLTIENYAKAIYLIGAAQDNPLATTGQLAEALQVSPGTVTSMLKTLSESGLAQYIPYEGARLTDAGRSLALRVLRRHRLIELFLQKTLNLSWDEVHEEAENMEHAVSDLLIDRIDAFLGYPASDPHGDPIPKADGTVADNITERLSRLDVGQSFRIARVLDQSPDFLRYLSQCGLEIGAEGYIADSQSAAGVVTLAIADAQTTLSCEVANQLLVEPLKPKLATNPRSPDSGGC